MSVEKSDSTTDPRTALLCERRLSRHLAARSGPVDEAELEILREKIREDIEHNVA